MKFSPPVKGRITAAFDQPRPLGAEKPTHIHGAVDIAASVGTPIYAPEPGLAFYWVAMRPEPGKFWPKMPRLYRHEIKSFPFANYFYDMFGGVIVLRAPDMRTHLITHSYARQLFNLGTMRHMRKWWVEESADKRFPISAVYSETRSVDEGDVIGYVGNAGYSTGAHIHWEVHPSYSWYRHEDRIEPTF